MAKDVKFNIRLTIDGKEQIVTASTNVKRFAEELEIARTKSTQLRDDLLKITQVSTSFQNVITGLQQLTGLMRTYTAANSAQIEAETKLANNMRNTMAARDEDIQSIKDLCAAQQELGVIGDEVQLAGAQELATYLEKKSSLEKLIPVMNDMVAQQYGLNATQESAANIATMLGKVMEGQVGALSRYGYKFDEAQAEILKFGTEEQRAAVLAEVVESAVGGMNEALAQTDAGKAKQTANAIGDIKEQVGALFSSIEPTIIAIGEMGMAFMALGTTVQGIRGVYVGMVGLSAAIKSSTIATYAQAVASKVAAFAQALWSKQLYYGKQASIAWAFGARIATVQAIAMRTAIIGLMAVTGVGLAIAAVSTIVSLFASNMDSATDSMGAANQKAREAKENADRLKEVEDATKDAYANASSTLEVYKGKLKNLIDAKNTGKDVSKDEKKIVGQLNDTYGETMGYFDSMTKWYNALISNSEAYCRQMVIEAKTRVLANQAAESEIEADKLQNQILSGKLSKKRRTETHASVSYATGQGVISSEQVEVVGTSEEELAIKRLQQLQKRIRGIKADMKKAVDEANSISFSVKGSTTRPKEGGTGGGKDGKDNLALVEYAGTYKDLTNNVAYYQQELEKCNIADTERIITLAKAKKAAEDAVQAFKDLTESAGISDNLQSLDDYDRKLQYLRKQRQVSSKEAIAGIDAEIEATERARKELESTAVAAIKDEEIRTYEQLNKKLQYYNRLLQEGDEQQRIFAQQGINRLNRLQEAWDDALDEMKLPATTNNLRDIDAAISFYTSRQQREDADQIQRTQRIIDDLTAKKNALQLGIELPQMQKEVADINAIEGKEHILKIRGIGFDELTERIKELNDLLADTENPVTDSQRKDIESLIGTYEKWRLQSISSFETLADGWASIKGIGGSVQNITDALEGNGDAWRSLTAIVDGFIQLYESIRAIVGLVQMFTAVTTAHTAAKTAESVATGIAAGAETEKAVVDEAAALAVVPVIAANKAATASYMELASAMYFAAHASIPFAGFGIAQGFVTAATAIVQAIGLMPFANGAIVSGPTMALVGEYAGASNNPEVIAPLDKLRTMIQPAGGVSGVVRFEIDGRKLVGVIANETRISSKSGRRTNIKV